MLIRLTVLSVMAAVAMASDNLVTLSHTDGNSEIDGAYVNGAVFTITDKAKRYIIENQGSMTEQYTLQSITLNGVYMHNPNETELVDTYPVYLYIINENDSVLGISELVEVKSYKKDGFVTDYITTNYTFSFNSDITLTHGGQYNILFKQTDNAFDSATGKVDYFTAPRYLDSKMFLSDLQGEATEWGLIDQIGAPLSGYNSWGFSMSIELSPVVPEPSTATLSLIALIAAATSRRRR